MPQTLNVSTGEWEEYTPRGPESLADALRQNPDLRWDPAADFESMFADAISSGKNYYAGSGVIGHSTGSNQLWTLDPVSRRAYRTGAIQPGVPWGATPSDTNPTDEEWLQLAAMAAPVVGAAYFGGAEGAAATTGTEAGTAGYGADAAAGGVGESAMAGGATTPAATTGAAPMDWWTEYGLTAADVGEGAAATGGDWWSQYGLTAADVGESGAAAGGGTLSQIASAAKSMGITPASLVSLIGRLAPGALGAVASNKQAGALDDLSRRYETYGAPSRARYETSMTPGFDPNSIPGYSGAVDTASKSLLARLSATGGNPFGNPGGLIDANKQIISGTALPAIQEYQRLNAGTGFGTTLNAAGGFSRDAVGAESNVYNAIGAGINDAINPPKTLAEQLAELKRAGLFTNNSLA